MILAYFRNKFLVIFCGEITIYEVINQLLKLFVSSLFITSTLIKPSKFSGRSKYSRLVHQTHFIIVTRCSHMSSTMLRIKQPCFTAQLHQMGCRYADTDSSLQGTKLLTYLLTYLLHGAESFLRN